MAGRRNKPVKDGKTASPSRLDQFGDMLSEETDPSTKKQLGIPREHERSNDC